MNTWRATGALLVVASATVGCVRPAAIDVRSATPSIVASAPTPLVSPEGAARSPGPAEGATPPHAALAAEGGDAVVGQLGTYLWLDGGSDAPWLPGAPIHVGTGEPLTVTLDPVVEVVRWRARYAPAGGDGLDSVRGLAGDDGVPITFAAPERGRWSMALHVTFAGDLGSADWFWALDVD